MAIDTEIVGLKSIVLYVNEGIIITRPDITKKDRVDFTGNSLGSVSISEINQYPKWQRELDYSGNYKIQFNDMFSFFLHGINNEIPELLQEIRNNRLGYIAVITTIDNYCYVFPTPVFIDKKNTKKENSNSYEVVVSYRVPTFENKLIISGIEINDNGGGVMVEVDPIFEAWLNLTPPAYPSDIPNITGLLDETAHDLLDHAGLTGIPSIAGLEATANKDISGGYVGKTLEKINFWNTARTFMSFFVNAATAARTYTFPDKDGTIAMTSDINAAYDATLGTGGDYTDLYDAVVTNGKKALIMVGAATCNTTIPDGYSFNVNGNSSNKYTITFGNNVLIDQNPTIVSTYKIRLENCIIAYKLTSNIMFIRWSVLELIGVEFITTSTSAHTIIYSTSLSGIDRCKFSLSNHTITVVNNQHTSTNIFPYFRDIEIVGGGSSCIATITLGVYAKYANLYNVRQTGTFSSTAGWINLIEGLSDITVSNCYLPSLKIGTQKGRVYKLTLINSTFYSLVSTNIGSGIINSSFINVTFAAAFIWDSINGYTTFNNNTFVNCVIPSISLSGAGATNYFVNNSFQNCTFTNYFTINAATYPAINIFNNVFSEGCYFTASITNTWNFKFSKCYFAINVVNNADSAIFESNNIIGTFTLNGDYNKLIANIVTGLLTLSSGAEYNVVNSNTLTSGLTDSSGVTNNEIANNIG